MPRPIPLPKPETYIGRHPDNDIVLPADPTVSRRHAQLVQQPAGPLIVDLGSAGGTYVNGQQVERASLRDGDRIRLGRTELQWRAGQLWVPDDAVLSARPAPSVPVHRAAPAVGGSGAALPMGAAVLFSGILLALAVANGRTSVSDIAMPSPGPSSAAATMDDPAATPRPPVVPSPDRDRDRDRDVDARRATARPGDGRTFRLGDEVQVEVPLGAAPASADVTIAEVAVTQPITGAVPLGEAYAIGLAGADLRAPATVTLAFDPADLPEDSSAELVFVAYRETEDEEWTPLDDAVIDPAGSASVQTTHFSQWRLFAWSPKKIAALMMDGYVRMLRLGGLRASPPSCGSAPKDMTVRVTPKALRGRPSAGSAPVSEYADMVLTCAEGRAGERGAGGAKVKVRGNRSYGLMVDVPAPLNVEQRSYSDLDAEFVRLLAEHYSRRSYLPSGTEIVVSAGGVAAGASKTVAVAPSQLTLAAETIMRLVGWVPAGRIGDAIGVVKCGATALIETDKSGGALPLDGVPAIARACGDTVLKGGMRIAFKLALDVFAVQQQAIDVRLDRLLGGGVDVVVARLADWSEGYPPNGYPQPSTGSLPVELGLFGYAVGTPADGWRGGSASLYATNRQPRTVAPFTVQFTGGEVQTAQGKSYPIDVAPAYARKLQIGEDPPNHGIPPYFPLDLAASITFRVAEATTPTRLVMHTEHHGDIAFDLAGADRPRPQADVRQLNLRPLPELARRLEVDDADFHFTFNGTCFSRLEEWVRNKMVYLPYTIENKDPLDEHAFKQPFKHALYYPTLGGFHYDLYDIEHTLGPGQRADGLFLISLEMSRDDPLPTILAYYEADGTVTNYDLACTEPTNG